MLEDQLYRETLLEVVQNPKNRGAITGADLEAKLLNPLCGDEVRLQIKLRNGQTIEKAVFSGNGCAISQASASLLAESIEGKTVSQANKISNDDILKLMGVDPTPARLKCAFLSLDALKEALNNGLQS